jgi:uncharacterized membrane protein
MQFDCDESSFIHRLTMTRKLTTTLLLLAASTGQSLAFQSSPSRQAFSRAGSSILSRPVNSIHHHLKTSSSPLAVPSTTSLGLSWPSVSSGRYEDSNIDQNTSSEKPTTRFSKRIFLGTLVRRTAYAFVALALFNAGPALAAKKAAKDTVEHLHTGQKIANFFMGFGLPKLAVLATISAMPVVELRGAIPVGVWMGLPIWQVFLTCVFGNMIPIIPLLFLLKNESLKNLMSPILKRAEKKASGLGVGSTEKQWVSLAAFVGIPLPGTGAWTGTTCRSTLILNDMCPLWQSIV